MKLECSPEKLKNALSQAERITGKNLTLPILGSILLIATGKTLKLRATNLSLGIEIEIPAKVEVEGVAAIRGDVVSATFATMASHDMVTLELVNENLVVTTKQHRVLIKNYSHEDFPTIPIVEGQELFIDVKKFIDGVKSVYYSCALSDIKPEIASVYIYQEEDFLTFVATDAFRLAEKKVKVKGVEDFPGLLIPYKNIVEIVRLFQEVGDEMKLIFSKNQLSLTAGSMYVTSRIIDGSFPDYRQILPKEKKTEATILKQEFVNALKLSNVFSDKFNQVTLRVVPETKKIEVFSKNTDVGENATKIDAAISGEVIEVNLNYKHILDCFQSISQDSVSLSFTDPMRPVVVRGLNDSSFLYLLMPMNR